MAKKKPVPSPKQKRNSSCLLFAFLLFAACVIIAALTPKTSGQPGPTDPPRATDIPAATLSHLQIYQTATWDALTARAELQSYLAPTQTQQAQDRADAATMQYYVTQETRVVPTLKVSGNTASSGGSSNFDNVSGGSHDDGKGPTALCYDGSLWSNGIVHKGACSHHNGVKVWYR